MYSLLAEDIVLSHSPYRFPSQAPLALQARAALTEWEMVKAQIMAFGFRPDQADPWEFLGITKLEGPTPGPEDINNRLRAGKQMAGQSFGSQASAECQAASKHFLDSLCLHSQACLDALPGILRERKKLAKHACNWRWMEVCPDFLTYLCSMYASAGWTCGLHISNIHEHHFDCCIPHMLPSEEANMVYRQLHGPNPTVASALHTLASLSKKLILWAPTDQSKLATLLGEAFKFASSTVLSFNLMLVIPYDPMPHCDSVELIQELWTNPVLQGRYTSMIKAVKYYSQPMRCVFTGPVGPMHHMKSLATFHVSNDAVQVPPSVVNWKTTLVDKDLGHVVLVDVPMHLVVDIHAILARSQLHGLIGWEPARRSPAHSPANPRQLICGYFNPQQISVTDLVLLVKGVRSLINQEGVFVGSHLLYKDETSFVLDFGDVLGLEACRDLIQEIVLISKKRAIVTTYAPKLLWEPILTTQAKHSPLAAITSIRFRKMLRLPNNVWMKPALTADQVSKFRQQAALATKPTMEQERAALQMQLRIEGLPQVGHEAVCADIMSKVSEVTKLPLAQSGTHTPSPGQWAPCYRGDGSFAQQIVLQLPSKEALQQVIVCVHGSGIKISGYDLSIEARSAHASVSAAGRAACNTLWPSVGGPCL